MKPEARRPKAERRPNSEIRGPKPEAERGSSFGLLSAFDLRISAPARVSGTRECARRERAPMLTTDYCEGIGWLPFAAPPGSTF